MSDARAQASSVISEQDLPRPERIAAELETAFEAAIGKQGSLDDALNKLDGYFLKYRSRPAPESQWLLAIFKIKMLDFLVRHQRLGPSIESEFCKEVHQLIETLTPQCTPRAIVVLESFFYETRAKVARQQRKPASEWWWQGAADETHARAQLTPDPRLILQQAQAALRMGFAPIAIGLSERVVFRASSPAEEAAARLLYGQAARLSGRLDDAWLTLELQGSMEHADAAEFLWERTVLESVREANLSPMMKLFARGTDRPPLMRRIEAYLWLKATDTVDKRGRISKPTSIRRNADDFQSGSQESGLYRVALLIEKALDDDSSAAASLETLLDAYESAATVPTVEQELLLFATIARRLWSLGRFSQADIVLSQYRSIGMRLSGGRDHDPIGIFRGWPLSPANEWPLTASGEPLHHPSVGGPRASEYDQLAPSLLDAAQIAANFVATAGEASMIALKSAVEGDFNIGAVTKRQTAKLLSSLAKRRKGVLFKVAQMGSYLDQITDQAMKDQFSVVEASVPPIGQKAIDQIFAKAFGRSPTEMFTSWSYDPVARGSIGEVLKATLPTGETVAVKIQYPEVRKYLTLDMRRGQLIRPVLEKNFPTLNYSEIFQEVYEHILAETSYNAELKNNDIFRRLFADDPRVSIPKPHPDWSTDTILVTDWVEGRSLGDFIANSTQEQRNEAATIIYEVFLRSYMKFGILNCDPHPGNFLFSEGRVHFMDFGCVKRLPRDFLEGQRQMQRAQTNGDSETFNKLHARLGFLDTKDPSPELKERVWSLQQKIRRHILGPQPFTFTPEHVQEVSRAMLDEHPFKDHIRLPKDYVFLLRFEFGLMSILGRLGATADWRAVDARALR